MEVKTTDKNGREINVGDFVQVVNRIKGSIEDSGIITKIDGKQVHLGAGYIDGKLVSLIYLSDRVIKK